MKMLKNALLSLLLMSTFALASPAFATTYTFVGSWTVDSGPYWPTVPPAYSGQQAAAFLFGGTPSQYAVSIVSTSVTGTNWISTWGGACAGIFPCGTVVADTFVTSTGGFYENPGDTSAYVNDWAVGSQYTNYAFLANTATPEPSSLVLLGTGVLGLTAAFRRRLAR